MADRRIVITGTGWVTPLGADVASVWSKLLAGENAMGRVERFEVTGFATDFAAEVKNFDLAHFLGARAACHGRASRGAQYALAAAAQAWVQAGLGDAEGTTRWEGLDPDRMGVYLGAGEGSPNADALLGCGAMAWDTETRSLDSVRMQAEFRAATSDQAQLEEEPHMAVAHVAAAFGAEGPALNCMTACAASTQSVGEAAEILRRGDADIMLAGGSHSMIHTLGMTGFIRLTAMSTRRDDPATASRPFNRTRDGFVMGEGAGMLVLETAENALKRGANILCEIAGYGSTADAFRITDIKPDGSGGGGAMRRALAQGGIDPAQLGDDGRPPVHYVSAHGTGTTQNDSIETRTMKYVFGEHAPKVPFSSVKSMLGHLIQAAGAVELITCVKAIETGWAPPTINLHEPDEVCDLDYVPNAARDLGPAGGVDVAMSNGFGFGGQNDSVLVRRWLG